MGAQPAKDWTLIRNATEEQVATSLPGILDVYRQAFGIRDPDVEERFRTNSLDRHRSYPGFRLDLASDDRDVILGFCYGYRSMPGGWWHDRLAPALRAVGHSTLLDDAFEFVELAVLPARQGSGIGGRLHDSLLHGVGERHALLSTDSGPTHARMMYERRHWTVLLEPFRYLPDGDDVAIMGLDLGRHRPGPRL